MTVTVHTHEEHDDDSVSESSVVYGTMGEVSDGYHTFDELYRFRMLYNAALFNEWANRFDEKNETRLHNVHKSWKHSDGEPAFGGGWFVIVAQLPTGQITNHYEAKHWDLFQIPAKDRADKWDGHSATDVADRLYKYLSEVKR